MDTKKIRRFLESHAYSIPATKDADEMLAALDDIEAEAKAANDRAQDMANLMTDQTARLRDTFAAAALTGLMGLEVELCDGKGTATVSPKVAATVAYAVADAMLKAREAK